MPNETCKLPASRSGEKCAAFQLAEVYAFQPYIMAFSSIAATNLNVAVTVRIPNV